MNPVSYQIINEDIAYIKITTFSFDADKYFDGVMAEINDKGIKNVILDLRNNGGGSVQAAVNIAKYFVPEGIITTLDFESPDEEDMVYTSDLKENPYNLVLLVNEFTASSSELLAAAVRDTYSGVVVGEKTYGKSVFQQIFPIVDYEAFQACYEYTGEPLINYYDILNNGIMVPESHIMGYVKLTVGEYLTPIGRKINKIGVRPMKVILNQEIVNDIYIEGLSGLYCVKAYNQGDSGAEILRSKYILKAIGYNEKLDNDIMDQSMNEVVKQFQDDQGLSATGALDIDTQKLMNQKLYEIQRNADKQLLKAIDILKDE
jgi:carboxyl-terminal processing protease